MTHVDSVTPIKAKSFWLLFLLFFTTSCLSLKVKDIDPIKIETEEKFSLTNKKVFLKVTYSDNESTNLSQTKKKAFDSILPKNISDFLIEKFQSKIVNESIDESNIANETIDGIITISITENTISDESTLKSIFRGLSFGFYRQYLTKEFKYELSYQDKHTTKKGNSTVVSEFGYQAPMLIIPLNLDKHPFSQNQQINFHKQQIANLLNSMVL